MMLTKLQMRAIGELQRLVAMQRACPTFTSEQLARMNAVTNRGFGDVDADCIREATRIYRESWIEPILTALLADDSETLRLLVGDKPIPPKPPTESQRILRKLTGPMWMTDQTGSKEVTSEPGGATETRSLGIVDIVKDADRATREAMLAKATDAEHNRWAPGVDYDDSPSPLPASSDSTYPGDEVEEVLMHAAEERSVALTVPHDRSKLIAIRDLVNAFKVGDARKAFVVVTRLRFVFGMTRNEQIDAIRAAIPGLEDAAFDNMLEEGVKA